MRKFCIVLIAVSGLLRSVPPSAQVTNVPPTELETFEAQTGTVIVKGAGQIGSLAVGAVNITVISKESMDVKHRPQGIRHGDRDCREQPAGVEKGG